MLWHQMTSVDELARGFSDDAVVLQPTTLCNLNCRYCYLPERENRFVMSAEIAAALARDFSQRDRAVNLLWHGGEPLATGVVQMEALLLPFEQLRQDGLVAHSLQTNGTLINRGWLDLLRRFDFSVGVSIDGPSECNNDRITWSGKPTSESILRGIDLLRSEGIRFGVIIVVSHRNVHRAREVYNFAADLGCRSIGINIEEAEGLNRNNGLKGDAVSKFWTELLEAWLDRPTIQVREFRQALGWSRGVLEGHPAALGLRRRELYPTVAWQGDVVMLSPEFIGTHPEERRQFVVGNVLATPLSAICKQAKEHALYVRAFLRGVQRCERSCSYFSYCRGGTASNKYFETGSVDATVTNFCTNNKQRLMEVVLDRAKKEGMQA
jgi:uncharacterized protein